MGRQDSAVWRGVLAVSHLGRKPSGGAVADSAPQPLGLQGPSLHSRNAALCAYAVPITRIHKALSLLCPICGGKMGIIALVIYIADIWHILEHVGEKR